MSGPIGILALPVEDRQRIAVTHGFGDRQAVFARAILDPLMPVPAGLVDPEGQPSEKRFAVYRNNVVVGLIETLKAAYPVIHRLVGEEFFVAMARAYVAAEPPASPIMLDYGVGFPEFVRDFEPAAMLAYLPDVARLERAWVEAYHAPEALPLTLSALSQVAPSDLPTIRLVPHPSVRIVRSTFPIVSIWQANVGNNDVEPINLNSGEEDALVARPDAEVEIRRLPAGAAAFMDALQAGVPIADAVKGALSASPSFDLATTLRGMMEANVIAGFDARPILSGEMA